MKSWWNKRAEFETRASSYELMAREVAMTELQQQRVELSADHSAHWTVSLYTFVMKNRKLKLKDWIARLESKLTPDLDA